jgi:hypothetical protein
MDKLERLTFLNDFTLLDKDKGKKKRETYGLSQATDKLYHIMLYTLP